MSLKYGSRGQPVTNLQFMLNELGTGASLKPDGTFGHATDQEVRKLQKRLRLEDDGIVGNATLGAVIGNTPLTEGSRGPRVRALQLKLGVDSVLKPKLLWAAACKRQLQGYRQHGRRQNLVRRL
jgi:hypothetical protein